jgi:hypothetical protein
MVNDIAASTTTDPVIPALESQVDCYRRLAKLASVQHDHVQQGRTESLLEVLLRRQEVLDRITALEATMAPVRRRWAAYLDELGPEDRAHAERLMGEGRRLLEQITTADRDDAMVLQQRKIDLGRQIGRATTARQVNRSYAAAAYGARVPRMDVQR